MDRETMDRETGMMVDERTAQIARQVASVVGKPVDAVVREAIEAAARTAGVPVAPSVPLTPAERLARLREISDRSAARPVLDPRPADAIVEYDERGWPR
jgi:hypothetical protein